MKTEQVRLNIKTFLFFLTTAIFFLTACKKDEGNQNALIAGWSQLNTIFSPQSPGTQSPLPNFYYNPGEVTLKLKRNNTYEWSYNFPPAPANIHKGTYEIRNDTLVIISDNWREAPLDYKYSVVDNNSTLVLTSVGASKFQMNFKKNP